MKKIRIYKNMTSQNIDLPDALIKIYDKTSIATLLKLKNSLALKYMSITNRSIYVDVANFDDAREKFKCATFYVSGAYVPTDTRQIYSLNLRSCRLLDISSFNLRNIKILDITGTCIEVLPRLDNLTHLNAGNTKISDVTNLRYIAELNLSWTNVTDCAPLGWNDSKVTKLSLAGCRIKDVSMLFKIPYLDLSRCHLIDNITAFGLVGANVRVLNMSGCRKLSNVHPIGWPGCQINELNLSLCGGVNDISTFGQSKLTILHLNRTGVKDVSALGQLGEQLKELDLSDTIVNDVSMLDKVQRLNLYGCRGVVDISKLCNVPDLNYDDTNVITKRRKV